LRDEWGFDGFVLTDWFGIAETGTSARAGLDLEMPGPGRAYGRALADAVRSGDVAEKDLDEIVTRLLTTFARLGALGAPEPRTPEGVDTPEHRAIAREAATSAIVLLRNDGLLPLQRDALRRVAVIGPNADRAVVMGGGSAQVVPPYRVTPLRALRKKLGDAVEILYEPGVDIDKTVPVLASEADVEVFTGPDLAGAPALTSTRPTLEMLYLGAPSPDVDGAFSARARARFTPSTPGPHDFTLVQAGRARVVVDGVTVLDGFSDPPPRGTTFFGFGSEEATATVELAAGRAVDVVVEYASDDAPIISAARVGVRPTPSPDSADRAVAAARDADVVIVVAGTTNEWESEGHDRDSMDLPAGQDDLIARVVAANPDTVVVLNTGSPTTMPWAGDARAVLQAWFGGQETANAIADVLVGDAEPGGRLPTTFPVRLDHNPSFGNFPGERDEVRYGEGLLVGYRWYDARSLEPRFCFGHGLSYTTFTVAEPVVSSARVTRGERVTLDVTVTNTGTRAGSEVVQCYVAPRETHLVRPPQELKAFAKVRLGPGASETVTLTLDERAFAYWDPGRPDAELLRSRGSALPARGRDGPEAAAGWRVDPGVYDVRIARSSRDVVHTVEVEITDS
ncbi:MAG TPA: glycoside hydrolase family 3 C-terminal domain-containing protein, partial [Acidimicrobiia bacterium]|nr:glycoside hydrolase family 3 C-terminal domain-containing protein [Acidimicrobiia bacterium]